MEHIKKYKIEDESFENLSEEEKSQNDNNNPFSNSIGLPTPYPNKTKDQNNNPQSNIKAQNPNQDLNNISEINFTNLEINDESITQNNNFHHVQIIDEDVENFKRRIDIMIKNFRTDTLKDFMGIKRNMLLEQKSVIESERQKCDALLSSKGDLVEHLKEDLAKTQHELNSQITIKEKISFVIFKDKYGKYTKQLKQKAFYSVLKKYHDRKKGKRTNEALIRKKYHLRLKTFIFENLKKNWKEMTLFKIVSSKESECQNKLNEMAQYYGKEISDLKNRLNEANQIIDKTKEAKNAIQENLKKVLMRGVMAMNMEAMNVLDKDVDSNGQMMGMNILNPMLMNNKPNQVEVNQSFNPSIINNTNHTNTNNVFNQLNETPIHNTPNQLQESFNPNPNPIIKDVNWINASAVPSNMKTNLLSKESYDEFNMEIHDTGNDFNDEDSLPPQYNINPMAPVDNKYNKNFNQMPMGMGNQPMNMMTPYDEMQKNLSNIKNEFSAIKQNSIMEDSFNNSSSGFGNTYLNQQPHFNVNVNNPTYDFGSKMSNYSTVTNTNIINQQLLNTSETNNSNPKKKGLQGNNSSNNLNNNNANIPSKKGGNIPNNTGIPNKNIPINPKAPMASNKKPKK